MEQSAIEWYHNEMESLRVNSEINNIDGDLFIRRKTEIFERAKEMFRDQIEIAYYLGYIDEKSKRMRDEKQYYNDTYKPKE
jgi:hypothetical protein